MTWLFNKTEPVSLRITVGIVAALQMLACFNQLWLAASGRLLNGVIAAFLLAGAIGLCRRLRWARLISLVFLWGIIAAAIGSMSPFRAGDDLLAGMEPPSVTFLILQLAMVCAFTLSCMHVLGKYKDSFRRGWV
jgi:hypothetical protein